MRVFVTGATGHNGSFIVSELITAGHEVTGLARSEAGAAALSALGAKVRQGELADLDGLGQAAAEADGVIHTAVDRSLLLSGRLAALVAADLAAVRAFGVALAGSGKPLVVAASIGAPGQLGRPVTEQDPAAPVADEHQGTLRSRNDVEVAVLDLAQQAVRSSVVRLPPVSHSDRDRSGFLAQLIAVAKEKGIVGYPGDGANRWSAVAALDVAALFRLALEAGTAGKRWHAIGDEGLPFREIAESVGERLGLPVESIPADRLREHFGFLGGPVALDAPASSLVTQRDLGWRPVRPGLIVDLDNGRYFSSGAR